MKLARFWHEGAVRHGVVAGDDLQIITGDIFGGFEVTKEKVRLADVRLLAPCSPTKAVCVGLNYHDHAKEMNLPLPAEPLIFLKPASAVANPGDAVEYPAISANLHFEAELAAVIGKPARKITAADAPGHILGYTCANDVTARDLQSRDGQWTRGKSFDTFLPLGPWIETEIDPESIAVRLYLNNELKQNSTTAELIFKVPDLIAYISQVMTLYPGDVVLTGTPPGVGPMQPGDEVTVELGGIGRLTNHIVRAK